MRFALNMPRVNVNSHENHSQDELFHNREPSRKPVLVYSVHGEVSDAIFPAVELQPLTSWRYMICASTRRYGSHRRNSGARARPPSPIVRLFRTRGRLDLLIYVACWHEGFPCAGLAGSCLFTLDLLLRCPVHGDQIPQLANVCGKARHRELKWQV